ncbi:MAG: CoA transferase [Actinomycetota bacterium]|nr:CoA transferase [Actinomycetota bacterium]
MPELSDGRATEGRVGDGRATDGRVGDVRAGLNGAGPPLPLDGIRVLEYAQYVAGPFAGMLLADLGADVIKVEAPAGDAWRRYEPFGDGESRYFHALNRNKRSVVIDLKSEQGREHSERLIAGADAVIHNFPPETAAAYGLDRASVGELNPRAVWCCVSAFGSAGPASDLRAFDLVAQALSGLLLADVRPGDTVPRRAGGIAMADFTAGLLAALAVLAGLLSVGRNGRGGTGLEVSLLGAALAVQAQRFVSVESIDAPARSSRAGGPPFATPADLAAHAARTVAGEELEPYYRAYRAADGFFVVACLNDRQRRAVLAVTGTSDRFVSNPQAPPADGAERSERVAHVRAVEDVFAGQPLGVWIARLRGAGVPSAEVRTLDQLYDDPQAQANGLVASVQAPGIGTVRQLGSVFKVDGRAAPVDRPAPTLGQHTAEILGELGAQVLR